LFGAAIAALAVMGCATMQVSSFIARGTDFNVYRTYDWAPADQLATGDPRLDNNEFFQERVQTAVEKGLGARGLERAASGRADLVLHYHASVTQRVDAGGVDQKYGYCEGCVPSVFDAGTLTLDVVDARTKRLVWRGWAESTFDGVVDNQQWLEQRIDEAVARILERLPIVPALASR
jgi:predicted phage gp36 major capsid-like protein